MAPERLRLVDQLSPRQLPLPTPAPIARISPSLAESLRSCGLRVAFRADPGYNQFQKPAPSSALGLASHSLTEAVSRGKFDSVDESHLHKELQEAWDAQVAAGYAEIQRAWPMAVVPPPERWPGYQLTRVRLIRMLTAQVTRRRASEPNGAEYAEVEQWLEAPEVPLRGRPDRVERSDSGVDLIDLKSGWAVPEELRPSHKRQLLIYAYLWHAVHGEWPRTATVQRLDGRRLSFTVDPGEAAELVAEILQELDTFNRAVGAGASGDELASPSASACRYCEYRAVCSPFFNSLEPSWQWYRKSLFGVVMSVHEFGAGRRVDIHVAAGNLPPEVETAALLDVPKTVAPRDGDHVSVIDALPTRVPTDLRAAWDTQLCVWTEARG